VQNDDFGVQKDYFGGKSVVATNHCDALCCGGFCGQKVPVSEERPTTQPDATY
jgi:hypothetical protein